MNFHIVGHNIGDFHSTHFIAAHLAIRHYIKYVKKISVLIGERSEPTSDKLGGEICIATRTLVCIYLYIYMRTA